MRFGAWGTAVVLVTLGGVAPAGAQPLMPVAPARDAAFEPLSSMGAIPGRALSNPPPPILGAPIGAIREERPVVVAVADGVGDRDALPRPTRAAMLGAPTTAAPIPARAVESPVTPASGTSKAAPTTDPVGEFLSRRTGYTGDSGRTSTPVNKSSGKVPDEINKVLGEEGEWFRSDHAFDGFVSPVSNPFLFEDPRSLTEVRPLFIYQKIPNGQNDFQGGNISYFGVQGRAAITNRWSIVFNKLGGIWLNPSGNSSIGSQSGFAELWLGPKYTFIRNETVGRLMAAGLQFQIPVGSQSAYQHTGTLSLVPYVSFGQNMLKDWSWGSLNVLANTGWAISVNSERSDYLYISGHIDWDIKNLHRFYPLFELNYFVYTSNGTTYPIGSEGRDLINFGGQASGSGMLSGAFGARFKITESAQTGFAFELPFAGPKDLMQYRFTVDFVLKY